MEKIKVILADDHDIVILGLKHLLSRTHDIEVVAVTTDGQETLIKVEQFKPDVVVLDIDLPLISGIEVTEIISKDFPGTKVILHTAFTDEEHIVKGFEAGAFGYVPKNFKTEDLIEAIRTVNNNQRYIKGAVSETFISSYFKSKKSDEQLESDSETIPLTEREIEILKNVTEGYSNQDIADRLNISIRTVETHKSNIMKKLNIDNTAELVKYALRNNIIQL
jgi:DNA-binding NarL/FixJ family response regulator